MKTILTRLDPADFIGPEQASPEQEPSEDANTESESTVGENTVEGVAGPVSHVRYVGPKVKLEVSVDEESFAAEIDEAFKKISQQVRVPGFRPGHTPRKVLEAKIGAQAGRAQALEDSIPRMYTRALRDNDVEAVGQPEIEVTAGLESGAVEFEAIVEVRPQVEVTGYEKLRIELPSPVPGDDEIDERIQATLAQSSELAEVSRPAQASDHITIDIEGTVEGEPLPGLSAQEYVYEVGSAGIVAEVDEQLTGAVAGSDYEFSAAHPVQEDVTIDFQIKVHKVSERVLPELTDEWVDENTEHDNVETMRSAIVEQLGFSHKLQATMSMRSEAERMLADLVPSPVPDSMIAGAVTNRIQELASQLQQRQMEFEQWLQSTGQSADEFMQRLRDEAEVGVKLNLALTAVTQTQEFSATEEEVAAEYERLAEANNTDVASLTSEDGSGPSTLAVKSWLAHNKAMDWIVESAELVDPDGSPIDRADLELKPNSSDDSTDDSSDNSTDEQDPSNESTDD